MKNAIFITLLLLVSTGIINAQTRELYTQYLLQPFLFNPSLIGIDNSNSTLFLGYRKQWVGINNSPETSYLGYQGFIEKYNSGVGGLVTFDQIGPLQTVRLKAAYGYQIFIDEARNGWICLGANAKYEQQQFFINKEKYFDDLAAITSTQNSNRLDADVGLAYRSDYYTLGFSVENIFNIPHRYLKNNGSIYNFENGIVYNASANLVLNSSNNNLKYTPSVLFKFQENVKWQFDFSLLMQYKNTVHFGLNYRKDDALGVLTGFTFIKKLRFIYSYDIGISDIIKSTMGSHELTLNYQF